MANDAIFGLALTVAVFFTAKDIFFSKNSPDQVSGQAASKRPEHLAAGPTIKFLIWLESNNSYN